MNQERTLTFNLDGSIDPAQLEGMPQDFIDRVTGPEFQRQAAAQIRAAMDRQRVVESGRAVRALAQRQHNARRPDGVSGRQRKKLRRTARKLAGAKMQSEGVAHA